MARNPENRLRSFSKTLWRHKWKLLGGAGLAIGGKYAMDRSVEPPPPGIIFDQTNGGIIYSVAPSCNIIPDQTVAIRPLSPGRESPITLYALTTNPDGSKSRAYEIGTYNNIAEINTNHPEGFVAGTVEFCSREK